jgi:hypothetical protein
MALEWCRLCCTRHAIDQVCPGELQATTPERHAWRVNVETPRGVEAYGVLIAEAADVWRARILTYPNILWGVPGGGGTIKFVGATPQDAEQQAVQFIRAHCASRDFRMQHDVVRATPGRIDADSALPIAVDLAGEPAVRKIRFLPLRFGVVGATEPGGTANLSETGLFVITGVPIDAGSQLKMLLGLECSSIPLHGEVRWMCNRPHVGRSPGMGVQLISPPPTYLSFVRSLVC